MFITILRALSRSFSQCPLAPWTLRRFHTDSSSSFSSAMWMCSRILGHSPHFRTPSHMSACSCFSDHSIAPLYISHLSHRCPTHPIKLAHFPRRKLQVYHISIKRQNSGGRPGTAYHLGSGSGLKLDIVHHRPNGHIA